MKKGHIPAELKPEHITAVIDSREQMPLDLPLRSVVEGLTTGDYSVKGLEEFICVERKSLSDFLGCVGTSRERFERELQRMLAYPHRCLVLEFDQRDLREGQWNSKITPKQALGSCIRWAGMGIHIEYAGDRAGAATYVAGFLFSHARLIHRQRLNFVINEEPEGM